MGLHVRIKGGEPDVDVLVDKPGIREVCPLAAHTPVSLSVEVESQMSVIFGVLARRTDTMDRYEIEQALASFYKIHPIHQHMAVITVVNPEELGKTREEIQDSLSRLCEVGFYIVLPNQTSTMA